MAGWHTRTVEETIAALGADPQRGLEPSEVEAMAGRALRVLGAAYRRLDAEEALSGQELDSLDDAELAEKVRTVRVFARVSPEHKVRIVKAMKADGHIVSMTGDGVNDAPSLKAIFFPLSCNLGETLCIFVPILLGMPIPLLPIHLLWVNLVTDTFPALALGMEPGDPDVMKERPRNPKENLFARGGRPFVLLNGLMEGGLALASFFKVVPLDFQQWSVVWLLSLSTVLLNETVKLGVRTFSRAG